jgi:hypothetical protein
MVWSVGKERPIFCLDSLSRFASHAHTSRPQAHKTLLSIHFFMSILAAIHASNQCGSLAPTRLSLAIHAHHGVNFSQLNLTQCGSLAPTRLSLASPFHSCFPTTMCFAHSRRFSHSPHRRQQVNTSNTSNTSNTRVLQESLSTFIYLINKGIHKYGVCYAQIACYTAEAWQPIYSQM